MHLRRQILAGILSGLLSLFGLGRCDGNKEKDHLLDGSDMYYVPPKPFVEQVGEEEFRNQQDTLNAGEWLCTECGSVNSSKFCSECGAKKPTGVPQYQCGKCGWKNEMGAKVPKFCPECGDPLDDGDSA